MKPCATTRMWRWTVALAGCWLTIADGQTITADLLVDDGWLITPYQRCHAALAGDGDGQRLWLFGGFAESKFQKNQEFIRHCIFRFLFVFELLAYRNDLWEYDIRTNEWTPLTGNVKPNEAVPSQYNSSTGPLHPGSRIFATMHFDSSRNRLLLFGGYGITGQLGGDQIDEGVCCNLFSGLCANNGTYRLVA